MPKKYLLEFFIIFSLSAQAADFSRPGNGEACYENGIKVKDSRIYGYTNSGFADHSDGKFRLNKKTGEKRYTKRINGDEYFCFVKDFEVKLRCRAERKIIFESAYTDIENFEAKKRGFILQGIEELNGGVKVYEFQPGNVTCETVKG
ncbi:MULTISPECIES: hypothetical protein [Spongiibacter]|uniref:hypothetical protein n=1 Tax=Spongiibacter TaxID=630749 RepID=UPI000C6560C4|nr:hypothetical protein [Spongiibacter sp.]MBU72514.1 hypothetical protein [Spongiibacter sp.]